MRIYDRHSVRDVLQLGWHLLWQLANWWAEATVAVCPRRVASVAENAADVYIGLLLFAIASPSAKLGTDSRTPWMIRGCRCPPTPPALEVGRLGLVRACHRSTTSQPLSTIWWTKSA
jgi:hypothetical protein